MQIKNTIKYHYTTPEGPKLKIGYYRVLERMWSIWNSHPFMSVHPLWWSANWFIHFGKFFGSTWHICLMWNSGHLLPPAWSWLNVYLLMRIKHPQYPILEEIVVVKKKKTTTTTQSTVSLHSSGVVRPLAKMLFSSNKCFGKCLMGEKVFNEYSVRKIQLIKSNGAIRVGG